MRLIKPIAEPEHRPHLKQVREGSREEDGYVPGSVSIMIRRGAADILELEELDADWKSRDGEKGRWSLLPLMQSFYTCCSYCPHDL